MAEESKNIDGGWAWVVLACGSMALFLNGFLCYSLGVITEALLEEFHAGLSVTSAVGSVMIGVQCCTGPLASIVINKLGSRTCAVTGGIIAFFGLIGASFSESLFAVMWTFGVTTGIGYGFGYTAAFVMVAQYFKRLRPIASGVTVAGAALGMFVGPPTLRYLIDEYGLQGTFLIVAGIACHFCVIGALMRPLHIPKRIIAGKNLDKSYIGRILESIKSGGVSCTSVTLRNNGYILYILSIFCWNFAEAACLIHLPNYCVQQGTSKIKAAFLFTVMGLMNVISRLFTGFAANDEGISSLTLHLGQMGMASICTGLFPLYSHSFTGQMCYAALLGLYIGGANSLMNPITVDVAGLEHVAIGIGVVSFMAGLGFLSGPPVAGAIVDSGATYTESYMFAAAMFLMSSVLTLLISLFHKEGGQRNIEIEVKIEEPKDTAKEKMFNHIPTNLAEDQTFPDDVLELQRQEQRCSC